jgi:hypothetical protein
MAVTLIEGVTHTHQRHMMAQRQLHKIILLAQQQMTDLTAWAERTEQQYDEHALIQHSMPALIALVALAVMGGTGAVGWYLYRKWERRAATTEEDPDCGDE